MGGNIIFENKLVFEILDSVSDEEREIFNADPRIIDWKLMAKLSAYGMQKFVMKQESFHSWDVGK